MSEILIKNKVHLNLDFERINNLLIKARNIINILLICQLKNLQIDLCKTSVTVLLFVLFKCFRLDKTIDIF